MEIEALTRDEAESAFFTLIGMLDKLGCAPAAVVDKKEDEGVTFRLHFSTERVRRLLEATRPTVDLGEDGELIARLRARPTISTQGLGTAFADPLTNEAADRLERYREAHVIALAKLDDVVSCGCCDEELGALRAVLSRG